MRSRFRSTKRLQCRKLARRRDKKAMQRNGFRLRRHLDQTLPQFVQAALRPAARRLHGLKRTLQSAEQIVLDGGGALGLVAVAGIDEAFGDAGLLGDLLIFFDNNILAAPNCNDSFDELIQLGVQVDFNQGMVCPMRHR